MMKLAVFLVALAAAFSAPAAVHGCGDMTRDGSIDVTDMIQMVAIILSGDGTDVVTSPVPDIEMADVNLDNTVNIADILITVNWFLNPTNDFGVPEACVGCPDDNACNKGALETKEREGQCIYPPTYYRCDDTPIDPINGCERDPATFEPVCYSCELDLDHDGVCDPNEINGCTDPDACNHGLFVEIPGRTCKISGEMGSHHFDNEMMNHPLFPHTDGPVYLGATKEDCVELCRKDDNCVAVTHTHYIDDQHHVCHYDCEEYHNELGDGEPVAYASGCIMFHTCLETFDADSLDIAGGPGHIAGPFTTWVKPTHPATEEDGSCIYPPSNYRCDAEGTELCINVDDSGISAPFAVAVGLNEASAVHTEANVCYACIVDLDEDRTCDSIEIKGCMDDTKCNYDVAATEEDGSCLDAPDHRQCDADAEPVSSCIKDAHGDAVCFGCVDDIDGDFVCDAEETQGCMNPLGCNHDIFTTHEQKACAWAGRFTAEEMVHPSYAITDDSYRGLTKDDCWRMCAYSATADSACVAATWIGGLPTHCVLFKECDEVQDWAEAGIPLFFDGSAEGLVSYTAPLTQLATNDDGSCLVPPDYYKCDATVDSSDVDGNINQQLYNRCWADDLHGGEMFCFSCINDADGDKVCDENEVLGCMNSEACNFDEDATDDDGSCLTTPDYYMCAPSADTDLFDTCEVDAHGDNTCFVCISDDDEDMVCLENEIHGCTLEAACNYDPLATENDGSCLATPVNYECNMESGYLCMDDQHGDNTCYSCISDVDEDEVCDQVEDLGCMNPLGCNYDPTATDDDGSCLIPPENYECDYDMAEGRTDYPGSCPNDIHGDLWCFRCKNDRDGDFVCDEEEIIGCTDDAACNHQLFAQYDGKGCGADSVVFEAADYPNRGRFQIHELGGETFVQADSSDDCLRLCTTTEGCAAATFVSGTNCHMFKSCEIVDAGEVFHLMVRPTTVRLATDSNRWKCLYARPHHHCPIDRAVPSCGEQAGDLHCPTACKTDEDKYRWICDEEAECISDTDTDGVCDEEERFGCTDEEACNYNHFETLKPTEDDDSCTYPEEEYLNCRGFCINDLDHDEVCDEIEIPGCMDPVACNFDADATDDDGSCLATPEHYECAVAVTPDECFDDLSFNDPWNNLQDKRDAGLTCDVATNNEGKGCGFYDNGLEEGSTCDKMARTSASCTGDGCDGQNPPGCDQGVLNAAPERFTTRGFAAKSYSECYSACRAVVNSYWHGNYINQCQVGCALRTCEIATSNDKFICEVDAHGDETCFQCISDDDDDQVCLELEIHGCTNSEACNFDAWATEDDGSCLETPEFYQCDADGYVCMVDAHGDNTCYSCISDADEDEVCLGNEIFGCTDPVGCNYNETATENEGCYYHREHYKCEEHGVEGVLDVCVNDIDGDEVCDENEVPGCMKVDDATFNPDATEMDEEQCTGRTADGACVSGFVEDCSGDGDCCNEKWLGDGYGDCYDQGHGCDLSCYDYDHGDCARYGCTDETACNYDILASVDEDPSVCLYQQDHYECPVFAGKTNIEACSQDINRDGRCDEPAECTSDVDGDGVCDGLEIVGCMQRYDADTLTMSCNYDPTATDDDGCVFKEPYRWCDTLECMVDKDGDGVCDEEEVGCIDNAACNFNHLAYVSDDDNDPCIYPDEHYDCDQVCIKDKDEDGVCDGLEKKGCMDVAACNYWANATDHIPANCSYIPLGSPVLWVDCDANCLNDQDGDEVCDEEEVLGCMEEGACNYNELATDGIIEEQCRYPRKWFDPVAEVYTDDEVYNCEDGCVNDLDGDKVCDEDEIPGCPDKEACNFMHERTDDALDMCEYPGLNKDCNADCIPGYVPDCTDLENGSTKEDTFCCPETYIGDDYYDCHDRTPDEGRCNMFCYDQDGGDCVGCQDVDACNWDRNVIVDDPDSCWYATPNRHCTGLCINDEDWDKVCDEDEIPGCTAADACNFDAEATDDDGSCEHAPPHYACFPEWDGDKNGECVFDAHGDRTCWLCIDDVDGDNVCDQNERLGCMDEEACNYHDWATDEDGTCVYPPTNLGAEYVCQPDPDWNDPCVIDVRGADVCFACAADADNDKVCAEHEVVGCRDDTACNYDPGATEDAWCMPEDYKSGYTCVPLSNGADLCEEIDIDGFVYEDPSSKMICFDCLLDTDDDGVCDQDEQLACKMPTACNYITPHDPKWDMDNSLCVFPVKAEWDCDGNCLNDADGDSVCDENEIVGCQEESACNYVAEATDAGACDYSCSGCMDGSACNYDAAFTIHDADACVYKLSEHHNCPTYSEDGTAQNTCIVGYVADCRSDHSNCCSYSWLFDSVCDDGSIEVRGCDLTCIEGNREETPCKSLHGESWTPP